MADGECAYVQGSGCGDREPELPPCDSASVPPEGDEQLEGTLIGRPCGNEGTCATAPGTPGLLVVALIVVLLRRLGPLALLLAFVPAAHAGIDAQHLQGLDGGTFPALREADAGGAWEPAGAFTWSYGGGLVTLVEEDGLTPVLDDVVTLELGGSIRLGELVRLGVSVPMHGSFRWLGREVRSAPFEEGANAIYGDVAAWAHVPILKTDKGLSLAAYVQVDFATGWPWYFLGDPEGGMRAVFAASRRLDGWEVLINAGVRLAEPTILLGQEWGTRGEYGVGVNRRIVSRLDANVELFGSVSLPPVAAPGDAPLELLATVGWDFGRGFVLRAGGGAGLTTGIGSPDVRAVMMLDARRRTYEDRDGDGIIDLRDRCPDDPEDFDGLQDGDGCPEEDLDADRIPDAKDACPKYAETYNGYADEEGCPDRVTELVLTVAGEGLEQASVTIGEEAPFVAFAEETTTLALPPGRYELHAEAAGFLPLATWVLVPEESPYAYTATLAPIRYGTVHLRVTDPADAPLAGYLRPVTAPGTPVAPLEVLPAEGRALELIAGAHPYTVSAPGYLPRAVTLEVPANGRTEAVVVLQPSDLRVVGSRVETTQQVRFALDSAEIPPDGEGPLDDLAALLKADRRIELLRIEGHADERGTSRYNLELSRRRAEAIRAWLIAAGVEPERLEAIGTGEARPARDGETASRRVEFTVLVWADEQGRPDDPAPR